MDLARVRPQDERYWDELRTKGQLEKVIDIIFSVTQGKGKARLNKDITQADAEPFTTMFIVASNYGLADTVYSQTESVFRSASPRMCAWSARWT